MKYDLIISNPPYGSPGNTITKNIIENVDYDCFVNLLPSNDYRRYNKGFKLYQFVDMNTIRPIMKGFKDAAVTTTLCMIMKERQYSRTQSEFEIENYIDESLKKYFYENARREHYAIDNPNTGKRGIEFIQARTFVFCSRDMTHRNGFPSGKKSVSYKWNVERSITWSEIVEKYNKNRAHETGKIELNLYGITFNTQAEFDNFNSFMYSEEGSRFMSIITKALNCDGFSHPSKWMPKVDWSRPWTPEQVLREYGYSDDEIRAALDDYLSENEFEIENYSDKSLKKYFYGNRLRKHEAIDNANLSGATDLQFKLFDIDKTVTFSSRDVNHHHLPYSKTCETYRYNVLKNITNEEIFESRKALRKGVYDGWLSITGILFETSKEKDNCVQFMYSKDGFRFLSKVFTAVNVDSTINLGKIFPKVDWTRPQTVESILNDYNYTPAEIAEILDDLKNYRYMDEAK